MQITFYLNKENFLKLYEWIKKEYSNIKFYNNRTDKFINESELYNGSVGYNGQITLTDEHSTLSNKILNNTYKPTEERYPLVWQSGIELLFGYSEDKIYNFDFSNYNPYAKNSKEVFYMCRFYLGSYYLESNEYYVKMYQKLCRRIRKYSVKLNGKYVDYYLYNELM